MKYFIYQVASGLFSGGPLTLQADATRIAALAPGRAVFASNVSIDFNVKRIDQGSVPLVTRDWTAQEIIDRDTAEATLDAREGNQLALLKNPQFKTAIKEGKTLPRATAWINAQANPIDAAAKLLMMISLIVRYLRNKDDDFFEGGE